MADTEQPAGKGFSLPLAIKFFLGSALLIALAVGAAVIVTYVKGDSIARAAVHDVLTTSSAVQKEFEQSRLQELQLKVQLIAADPSTARYVSQAAGATDNLPGLSESGEVDTKSIPDLLRERQSQSQYDFDLGIVLDAKGNVLGRSDQTEAFKESLAQDPLVKPAIANAEPYSGYWRNGDKLYQAAIMPLAQDQNLVGFLLLAQSVNDELCRQVAKVSGAQIAFWLPVDKHLELVASSLDDSERQALRTAMAAQPAEVITSAAGGHAVPRLRLHFASQEWGAQLLPTASEGVGRLGAVMALTSTDKVVASYRDILNWVVIGGLTSMLLALVLSYLFAKRILRPVRTMALAAEQAVAGNYQTHIGVTGSDELARLSHAFDHLLSDLREKSDIEGYVGNLSRFLPDPAREQAVASPVKSPVAKLPAPPQREEMCLLGLEFRALATSESGKSTELAFAAFERAAATVAAAAAAAAVRQNTAAQFVLGFAGEAKYLQALQALNRIRQNATGPELAVAAVLASGPVVHGTTMDGTRVLLGLAPMQLERLLPEAAPGQTLLTRQSGEELKALNGEATLTAAVGVVSGKRYYALSESALRNLPETSPPDGADAPTVIPAPKPHSRPSARRAVALDPGVVIGGRYRILAQLGAGGMGIVYKAHDLELDDVVALKMLRPAALLDGEQLERLKSEIKLARKITHPNVLRTFDFGEVDGQPFITMEYVRGLTLRYLLSETRRIPYTAGLRIARQLCAGLAAAHAVGVLHRDIKPENLILEQNGNAKLMDFGIARPIRRTGPGHTEQGSFVGTPNYSPPEQLAGEEVDQRADIYSCGVLMCEMFCGKLPFSGSNTMEIYVAQTQHEPIRPSAFWPEIPPPMETIILRCLKRLPQDRFASATELAQALAQLRG